MSLFSQREKKVAIVYHIGSARVEAGVVEFPHHGGEAVRIAASASVELALRDEVRPERHIADMLAALREARERVSRESPLSRHARIYAYSIASPWASVEPRRVVIRRSERFILTRAYVDKLVENHERLFERASLSPEGRDGMIAFERRIVDVRLDGKEAISVYGSRARKAELSIVTGVAPRSLMRRMIEVGGGSEDGRSARAFSSALAAFDAARCALSETGDFVWIDADGEIIDAVIARGGRIEEVSSFPHGERQVAREISRELSIPLAEALSLGRLSAEGRVAGPIASKTSEAARRAADRQAHALSHAPRERYIVGKAWNAARKGKDTAPVAREVGPEALRSFASFERGAAESARLAVDAMFAAKLCSGVEE